MTMKANLVVNIDISNDRDVSEDKMEQNIFHFESKLTINPPFRVS